MSTVAKEVFNAEFYLNLYADLRAAFGNNNYQAAADHWVAYGISEGRRASRHFDAPYYLSLYPDLQNAFGPTNYLAAVEHWQNFGEQEGRRATTEFDVQYYLGQYPDLQAAFGSDFRAAHAHWEVSGIQEGRRGSAEFDAPYYLSQYPDLQAALGTNYPAALDHWITHGRTEGRMAVDGVNNSRIRYDERKSPMPTAHVYYQIKRTDKFLSTNGNGKTVDLWHKDDESGRQGWRFQEVSGTGLYTIEVFQGVVDGRTFLSCTAGGKVDLWRKNDGSGRQLWKLTSLKNGSFTIEVSGGTNEGEKYLSGNADGGIDLWSEDDGSGNQQWQLIPEKLEKIRIEYDLKKAIRTPQPTFVGYGEVENETSIAQQMSITFGRTATETSSFQYETGFTFTAEVQVGVPDVWASKFSVSTTNTWTFGKEESRADSQSYTFEINANQNTKVVGEVSVSLTKVDVPYKATSKSKSGEEIVSYGTWTGVVAGKAKFNPKESSLAMN